MSIESRASQIELRNRRNDLVPFVDSEAIKEAARAVMDGMYKIRHRSGEIIYPYSLSPREIGGVRALLGRSSGGLVRRIGEFTPIRLEEGMGTVISIKEKVRR